MPDSEVTPAPGQDATASSPAPTPPQTPSAAAVPTSSPDADPQDLGSGQYCETQEGQVTVAIRTATVALAVPPPQVIRGYLDFYPEAAEKFFQWAEDESQHRRALDRKLVDSQIEDSRRGIRYGLVVSLAGLALAAFAVWMHEPWAASIIGGGTLVALAQAFIVGKNLSLRGSEKKPTEDD